MKTKNLILLIITFVTFSFTACGDDDDKGTASNGILGRWTLEDVSIGVLDATDSDMKESVEGVYEAFFEDLHPGDVCKFNNDGTGVFFGDDIIFSSNDNILVIANDEGVQLGFTYIIRGNRLILTLDMRKLIIDLISADITTEQLKYLKQTIKEFTVNITCVR